MPKDRNYFTRPKTKPKVATRKDYVEGNNDKNSNKTNSAVISD